MIDAPASSVPAGELCGVCVAAGRVYCPPEHWPAPSSGDAARELVEAWLDTGQLFNVTPLIAGINKLLQVEREATRTAIVGLLDKQIKEYELDYNGLVQQSPSARHVSSKIDAAQELKALIERTPLDELMKGGE